MWDKGVDEFKIAVEEYKKIAGDKDDEHPGRAETGELAEFLEAQDGQHDHDGADNEHDHDPGDAVGEDVIELGMFQVQSEFRAGDENCRSFFPRRSIVLSSVL